MRLFIAIQFNDEIIDALTGFQSELREQGVKGNFTPEENLHLTLSFIGDFNDPDAVIEAMESSNFRPFDIKLDGVGHFGDLFWVGLSDNPALNAYVKRLRHCLADAGIPFDKKRFSPHITLIRRAEYKYEGEIPVYDVPKGRMKVESISLMRSDRGKHGMIYTEIGSVE